MAASIVAEFIAGLLGSLALLIIVGVPVHNWLVTQILGMGLVVSKTNWDMLNVGMWALITCGILFIVGASIYAYNTINYRTGG